MERATGHKQALDGNTCCSGRQQLTQLSVAAVMPLIRKKGHHSKVLDAPYTIDDLPPLVSTVVDDFPYDPGSQMDVLRRKFMNELQAALDHKPRRDEKTKKYKVYKTVSEYLDDIGHPRSEVYPRCENCESLKTHRINYSTNSYAGRRKVNLENLCSECFKFTKYLFQDDDYQSGPGKKKAEEDPERLAQIAEIQARGLRSAVQSVVDFMEQMIEDADDDIEDLEDASKDGKELVNKLRAEGEEDEAKVVHHLSLKIDRMVSKRKYEERE